MTVVTSSPRVRRVRVLIGQVVVDIALFTVYAAAISVLLPARVAELDPHGKVGTLAAILSISFVATALASPLVGALSDRTRSRIGRRLPWMAAGALVGGLLIGLIGGASSVIVVGMLWVLGQAALHGLQVVADAYLVDVFAPRRRGVVAGVAGIAVVAGAAVGAVLSGSLVDRPLVVWWILAALVIVAVGVFGLLVRDPPLRPVERTRRPLGIRARAALAALRAHPDFVKVLLWRVAFSIAYGSVFGYLLYILTDLVGIPHVPAARLIGLATVLGGAAAVVSVVGGGWLSDRLGRRRIFLVAAGGLVVVGDLLLLARPTTTTVLVTAVLLGLGLGLSISCGRALGSQLIPDQENGAATGFGVINVATSVGQAAAPAVAALVIGWGGYPAVFVASMALALASAVPVLWIRSAR